MNVNDPAHLTEELHERADAARRGLTAALGGRRHYGRTADHARHDARRRLLRRMGAGGRRIRRHRNGEPRWSLAVRTQEDAAAAGEAARIAISLILRDEKGNFVFWRSEYVRKPAKGESRAFSIQIYGLPKYASYEAYAYAS
ncbi:hypothetical protein [Bifidobacterium sp.]|uniref:hypothetical protein n=1 Tax=Bifidobacterium sp. TaxID=41200 RepID=UPI00283F3B19|nr:hypothetical protein [Bifidobacterium sp.]MDR3904272.1 hypothetical protein [Bifidobacterium sp.]